MELQVITRDPLEIVGLETRTSNLKESNPKTARIPGLWHRFFAEQVGAQIPKRKNPEVLLGVYTRYAGDRSGEYSLIVGAEVGQLDPIPAGLSGISIPSARYFVFPASGPLPQAVIEAWGRIWNYFSDNPLYQRAYTADFELYDQRARGENPQMDIYIAIK